MSHSVKKIIPFSRILNLFVSVAFILSCDSGSSNHPYFSSDPILQAKIFASGIVSTELPEFATSFSPNGKTVYFNQASADRSKLFILQSNYSDGKWTEPVNLPFSDGTYRDVDPFVSPDGERLYFSSNRPVTGTEPKPDFDTWYVSRRGDGWSEPINPGSPLNSDANEIFVSITKNGTIYFSSFDSNGSSNLYKSVNVDGNYTHPEKIEIPIDGADNIGNPCISPDESFLVFSATSQDGSGNSDLYISRFRDDKWGKAKNLGKFINSQFSDFAPSLSPDGNYLFFTSERPGVVPEDSEQGRPPGDIYQVELP